MPTIARTIRDEAVCENSTDYDGNVARAIKFLEWLPTRLYRRLPNRRRTNSINPFRSGRSSFSLRGRVRSEKRPLSGRRSPYDRGRTT